MTTTDENFWSMLDSTTAADGFLGRMLVFEHRMSESIAEFKYVQGAGYHTQTTLPDNHELVRMAEEWLEPTVNNSEEVYTFDISWEKRGDWTTSADYQLQKFKHDSKALARATESDPIESALWNRASLKCIQLALALSASKKGAEKVYHGKFRYRMIDPDSARVAIEIIKWSTELCASRCKTQIADSDTEKLAAKILKSVSKLVKGKCKKKGYVTLGDLSSAARGAAADKKKALLHLETNKEVIINRDLSGRTEVWKISLPKKGGAK